MALLVGVDVGGTKVLAGEVGLRGRILQTATRRTPGRRVSVETLEDAITDAVAEVCGERTPAGVGLAAAGFVDADREHVRFAPHLPWSGEPVRARLAQRWGVPVALENDANCAALAENELGAARGAASVLVVTVGTGIGGAYLLEGRLVRGAHGMAGEFGHMQVVPDGRGCECGRAGCWEQYCSGNALVRIAGARLGTEATVLAGLSRGRPELLTGPMITGAAEDGDPVARQALTTVGEWLGHGLAGLVGALDPALVVVGGGVSAAGDGLLDPAREVLARSLVGAGHRSLPPLRAATLGPTSGLVGAALLARNARRPAVLRRNPDWSLRGRRRRRPGRAGRGAS